MAEKINEAEKVYAKYYELVDETRDFTRTAKAAKAANTTFSGLRSKR